MFFRLLAHIWWLFLLHFLSVFTPLLAIPFGCLTQYHIRQPFIIDALSTCSHRHHSIVVALSVVWPFYLNICCQSLLKLMYAWCQIKVEDHLYHLSDLLALIINCVYDVVRLCRRLCRYVRARVCACMCISAWPCAFAQVHINDMTAKSSKEEKRKQDRVRQAKMDWSQ